MYDLTLCDIAIRWPGATRILGRLGLDFCCGGRRTLADACASAGLDTGAVLRDLDHGRLASVGADAMTRWSHAPLADLAAHLVDVVHVRLRDDLPELIRLADAVDRAHAGHPDRPAGLPALLRDLSTDLLAHLEVEEQVLFPQLLTVNAAASGQTIRGLEDDHQRAGAALVQLRELTRGFTAPADACPTWRALASELTRFAQELTEHVHLENNVLFPRALCERLN